jgi:hypothetical protein
VRSSGDKKRFESEIVNGHFGLRAESRQLQAEGQHVDDAGVAHLSPKRYAHLNPYGKYRFNVDEEFHRKGLRPLRLPDSGLA